MSPNTHLAIVSPTILYALSLTAWYPIPISLSLVLGTISKLNPGFTISTGANIQAFIQVLNIAQIYLLLINNALQNPSEIPKNQALNLSISLRLKNFLTRSTRQFFCCKSRFFSPPYNPIQDANITSEHICKL